MLDVVIGIARADRAHRGLDLRKDELLVIVDVEKCLRGVGDAPYDLRRHLDRVAACVVDLDLFGNDVVRAHGDLLARQPGQHPAQPFFAVGAPIGAEQLDRRGFVRIDEIETAENERADDARNDDDHPFPGGHDLGVGVGDRGPDGDPEQHQPDE